MIKKKTVLVRPYILRIFQSSSYLSLSRGIESRVWKIIHEESRVVLYVFISITPVIVDFVCLFFVYPEMWVMNYKYFIELGKLFESPSVIILVDKE